MSEMSETTRLAGRREWTALAVLALPALLVSLDLFVMIAALPTLSEQLHASSSQQLWIMDIYGFMVAGFLITMGTLGDRIGRRKLLLIGAAVFGAASVGAAFAVNPAMLIGARAVLGLAGATITPCTLSLIVTLFRDEKQRAAAIGVWAGCFTVGAVIGPLAGGVLLAHFWWGSVLLLGVPAMVLLLIVGPVLLPEFRNPGAGRIDLRSVALSLAAILPVIYGLKEVARSGWHTVPVTAIVAGAVFGVAFLRRQRVVAEPLLDVTLFRSKPFSATLASMLGYTMVSAGTMTFVAQHLQLVEGLTPLGAGAAMVPGMAAAIVSFQVSPRLGRRFRPATLFPAGLLVSATGLAIVGLSSGTAGIAIGFTLSCLGTGPLVSLGTTLVISSVPAERAGSASGLAQSANEFGAALGIALLGCVVTAVYRGQITIPAGTPAAAASSARDTIAGAVSSAPSPQLLTAAHDAYTGGVHAVAILAAVAIVGLAVLLATALRQLSPVGAGGTTAENISDLQPQAG